MHTTTKRASLALSLMLGIALSDATLRETFASTLKFRRDKIAGNYCYRTVFFASLVVGSLVCVAKTVKKRRNRKKNNNKHHSVCVARARAGGF